MHTCIYTCHAPFRASSILAGIHPDIRTSRDPYPRTCAPVTLCLPARPWRVGSAPPVARPRRTACRQDQAGWLPGWPARQTTSQRKKTGRKRDPSKTTFQSSLLAELCNRHAHCMTCAMDKGPGPFSFRPWSVAWPLGRLTQTARAPPLLEKGVAVTAASRNIQRVH